VDGAAEADRRGYDAGMTYTYPAPAPPPRRSNTTRIVLIIVGVLLVLCCGGVAVAAFAFRSIQQSTAPVQDSVDGFLKHLQADETDAAYADLCTSTKARYSQSEFATTVHNRPRLASYSIVNTNVSNVNGKVSGQVTARLSYADGSSEPHLFPLVKEGDAWRICGQPY
jgi:hypothetical protein